MQHTTCRLTPQALAASVKKVLVNITKTFFYCVQSTLFFKQRAALPGHSGPVDQDIQTQPHHVHKVPIPSRSFKAEMLV